MIDWLFGHLRYIREFPFQQVAMECFQLRRVLGVNGFWAENDTMFQICWDTRVIKQMNHPIKSFFSYLLLYYIALSYISNCLFNNYSHLFWDILIILGHIISHFAGEANLGYSFARIKFGPGMKSPLVILPHEKFFYTVPETMIRFSDTT